MLTPLEVTTLTSGEPMRIARVDAPDTEWGPILLGFLEHKGEPWREHLILALSMPLGSLTTSCYVGLVDDEPACHIMIASNSGAGLLGHVYTRLDHRRKGAIKLLMQAVLDDVARGGSLDIVTLSTEFGSPAYAIYDSFGYRSAFPNGGSMLLETKADALDRVLAPQSTSIRPLEWGDWPWVNLVGMVPGDNDGVRRSVAMGLDGPGSAEAGFLRFMLSERQPRTAFALATSNAVVGWSTLTYDVDGSHRAEAYTLPSFDDRRGDLLAALKPE